MNSSSVFTLLVFCLVAVQASHIYVQNKCPTAQNVVFRGAYDKIYAQTSIPAGGQWVSNFNASTCSSCNIGINAGATLLAEFSDTNGQIWWNLSTDAGYQYPPFRFFTSAGGAVMYCDSLTCTDGHPGDGHINVVNNPNESVDLYVQYCGAPN